MNDGEIIIFSDSSMSINNIYFIHIFKYVSKIKTKQNPHQSQNQKLQRNMNNLHIIKQ
jgi:hypothetical protein